jgi:long-subunit fatty acid transport protein
LQFFNGLRTLPALLVIALLAAADGPAWAVTDEEVFRDLRFNFINPGARSLGMGGAFISIADDATAAQANPAGLTNLLEPQFFSELRLAESASVSTTRSFRDPALPEVGFDLAVETEAQADLGPTFISYVQPYRRVWFGVSYQEVLDTHNTTTSTYDFLFTTGSDTRTGEGSVDLELTNVNLSFGWKALERLRLGATVSYGRLSMDSRIVNTYADPTGEVIGDPTLAGAEIEMYRTVADGDDTDLTWTVGALVVLPKSVSLGAVYRQGGAFSVEETLTARPLDATLVPGQIAQKVFFNESDTLLTADNATFAFAIGIDIPDVLGLGASWRPVPRLTLALDAVRIEYSDLLEGFNSRLNVLTFGFVEEEQAAFTVDDQTNLHLGGEYLLGEKGVTWAVRAGLHQDKDNRIRSDFEPGGFGLGSNDNFPGRSDVTHISVGAGAVINERFQVDAAADHSDLVDEFVVSLIYSF